MTLLEVLTALVITGVLLSVIAGLLAAQMRLARTSAQRVIAADAVRTSIAVLSGEAHRGAAADVRALSNDSLALRSFRGIGIVCAAAPLRSYVRYRGDRLPDERKDSVLVIRDDGSTLIAALIGSREVDACAPEPDARNLEVRMLPHPADAALLLPFESGSYYLTARALRYRLGAEGRQPLTTESFRDAATSFLAFDSAGIRFRLHPAGSAAPLDFAAAFGARNAP